MENEEMKNNVNNEMNEDKIIEDAKPSVTTNNRQAELSIEPPAGETKKTKGRKKKTVKEKLKALTREKRSFKLRLLIAFMVSFAFAYTLLIFGPFELYLPNISYYTFSFDDLVMPMVLIGLGTTIVLTFLLMLFRGKLFNYVVSALFALTVGAYVQGNVLNTNLGTLDGTAIPWESMTLVMLGGLAVWALIFLIPYIVAYLKPKMWRTLVIFVSILLVGMQTVGLVTLLVHNDHIGPVGNGYLSNKTIYEVSPKNNVVMFLLDRLDEDYAKETFERYPDIKESLTDFTYYDNVCGSYSRTFPSVAYLLTGVKTDYTLPIDQYFKKAWEEGAFLQKIKDAGYESKIYTDVNYVIQNTDYAAGKIDNIGQSQKKSDKKKMARAMINLSAFRYAPLTMKPFFWMYTGELADITTLEAEVSDMHMTNDAAFWAGLREKKLSVKEDSKGSFIFYHMQGSHEPYLMDVDGSTPEGGTGGPQKWEPWRQIAGDFNMILDYIKYLKEMNLYDDTTIIITADHGGTGTIEELDHERSIALMVKPRGENAGEAMKNSAAPLTVENIQATVLKDLGIDYTDYGLAIDEVAEDAEVTRYFYMSASDPLHVKRDYNLITYEITGHIKDFNNWKIKSKERIKYPYYDA
ncbi:MAG: sulfatase-like hydrolase/transferase [Clostridiales bacterium]|nr:sulfatase-like hydrolase/transferase [Clostridiales bacterium]